MSTDEKLPPPGFKHMFRGGELVVEDAYNRFHKYLPPAANEAVHAYAKRLGTVGLAVPVTVDDARDIVRYKQLVAEAESRGLPLVAMTGPVPDYWQDAQTQEVSPLADPVARAAYIEAERQKAKPFIR